jgi:hypothetical protein
MNERKSDKPGPMDIRPATTKRGNPTLGRDIQAKIGQQLRAYYDGLVEPTPDRFVDLLRQLEKPGDKGSSE